MSLPMFTVSHQAYLPAIKAGDVGSYKAMLSAQNLGQLSHLQRLGLLNNLVRELVLNNANIKPAKYRAMMNLTLSKWNPGDPDEIGSVIGDLLSYIACDLRILKEVIKLYPDVTPVEVIESQSRATNGLTLNFVVDRAKQLFPDYEIGAKEIQYVAEKALAQGNKDLTLWAGQHLRQVKERQTKPDWVTVEPGETLDLLDYKRWQLKDDACAVTMQDVREDMADFIVNDVAGEQIEQQQLDDLIVAALSINTTECTQGYPGNPDRMFGPVNRRSDGSDCISGVIKGACRMLTCRCKDQDEEEIESAYDNFSDGWFDGQCNQCHLRIADLSHALRFPLFGGSWIGCYCTEECMNKAQPYELGSVETILVDTLLTSIEQTGILDRYALAGREEEAKINSDDLPEFLLQESAALEGYVPSSMHIPNVPFIPRDKENPPQVTPVLEHRLCKSM